MIALALKSTMLVLAAWATMPLVARRSAAERHAVWLAFFCGLLLLPLLENRAPVVATLPVLPLAMAEVVEQPGPALAVSQTRPAPNDLGWLWPIGTAMVVSYQLLGLVLLTWRYRNANPAPGAARWRRVRILESGQCLVPMTWGFFRPRILLPLSAREWTTERRRMVLIHELTHVRRSDVLAQWLGNLVCALYWWNPVVWKAAGRMQQEREKACDDAILRKGNTAVRYSQHLIDVARGASPAAALGMATQLEARIRAALDGGISRRGLTVWAGAAVAILAVAMVIPVAGTRLAAQANGGRLQGSVLDPSGGAIPDATVLLIKPESKGQEITRTGPDGRYAFPMLPEGKYAVEVRSKGFAVYHGDVTIQTGRSHEENLALSVGRVQETLVILSKRPPVQNTGQPVRTPQRIRIGGNVQATKLLRVVNPVYPVALRDQGVEGTVLLEGVIGIAGKLLSLRSLNSLVHPGLTKAALDAVGQWEYQPSLLNGQPVEVVTAITIGFRLDE